MHPTQEAVLQEYRLWYQQHIPRLFNYAAYWLQDSDLAADLTSSICEKALHQLHRYDPHRGSLDAWIFGIARNELRMYFRTQSRRPVHISLDTLPDIRSTAQSIEDEFENAERFRTVMRHFSQLSSQEKEVVSLRFAAGLPNRDVAEIMDISANQVGVVLHRALTKLRTALHEQIQE